MFKKLLFTLAVLLCGIEAMAQCPKMIVNFDSCKFHAIGYRGYSHIYPENTLLSIEESFKRGIKYCVMDVSLTSDGHYVLFHDDQALYRTTDGQGKVTEKTLEELKTLDAGSWKGYYFKGNTIPTLEDALLIAEKYKGYLYLNTKNYDLQKLKAALDSTHTSPDRLLPYVSTIAQAQSLRKVLPNTPWVWYNGGSYPDSVGSDYFYQTCVTLGCKSFEVEGTTPTDSNWIVFKAKVHKYGGLAWIYGANENQQILVYDSMGADGVESARPWNANELICSGSTGAYPDSLTSGNWRFEYNLSGLGIGSQIRPRDYVNVPANQMPAFNTCSGFSIAKLDGQDARVMYVPQMTPDNGLLVYTNFDAEDLGTLDGTYSVIMDVLIPASSYGKYIAILQTSPANTDDADLFINQFGAVGINSVYNGAIDTGKWTRIAYSVDINAGKLKVYIDGKYVGYNTITGTRWDVLNDVQAGEKQGFLLLSDDNNETAPVYMSALQIRDYPMDSLSMTSLGKASATGIPQGNADMYNVKIDGAIADSTLMDYDRQIYYFVMQDDADLSQCKLSFDLSYGATSDRNPAEVVDLNYGVYTVKVKSQDTMRTKDWTICVHKASETGIQKVKDENSISLYPNPASQKLNILLSKEMKGEIFVTDMLGKQQLHSRINGQKEEIDISTLGAGMYMLSVQGAESISVQKFVKE